MAFRIIHHCVKTIEMDMVPTFMVFIIQIITGSFLIFNMIVIFIWFVINFPLFVVAKTLVEKNPKNPVFGIVLKVGRGINIFVCLLMWLMFFVNNLRLDKQTPETSLLVAAAYGNGTNITNSTVKP